MFNMWESGQPDNYQGKEACAKINSSGGWNDIDCKEPLRAFICYGNGTDHFVLINNTTTWSGAQNYCREHHTDLASVRNQRENERVQNLVPLGADAWIGLFRDAWKWSDGNKSTYSNWQVDEPNHGVHDEDCVEIWTGANSGWNDESCSKKKPFFCYTVPVRRQIVRVKLQVNSTLDLNSTAVQVEILSQIKKKLQENGLSEGAKLSWNKQLDGQIFHKTEKRENRKRKRRSKDEF
ncbi:E-selectin-like [Sardina pilchardus]|uniref:E-selectin-like n=1 Tax=Sardina pilchardus TaxID=27697 RepID=UPI002E0F836E